MLAIPLYTKGCSLSGQTIFYPILTPLGCNRVKPHFSPNGPPQSSDWRDRALTVRRFEPVPLLEASPQNTAPQLNEYWHDSSPLLSLYRFFNSSLPLLELLFTASLITLYRGRASFASRVHSSPRAAALSRRAFSPARAGVGQFIFWIQLLCPQAPASSPTECIPPEGYTRRLPQWKLPPWASNRQLSPSSLHLHSFPSFFHCAADTQG